MPFVAIGSGFVRLISVSCDSIASLFIFVIVRIGFEPSNNHYLAAFVSPVPAFVARCSVTCHGYLSFL